MRAMPYNLQGKGVVEVSSICIPQISSPASKWKTNNNNLDNKFQQQQEEIEQLQSSGGTFLSPDNTNTNISTTPRATSSVDSEHTSTLDTTGPPTSTSSSFKSTSTANTAGVADPACTPKEDWDVSGGAAGGDGGGGGLGLEEWDSMFPNGEGALLPWIMGEADDMGMGLKHLLQSGNPVDYEGNAGLGVVDQGSGFETLSPPPPQPAACESNGGGVANLGFPGNNGKISSISHNCSSGILNGKVNNKGLNPNCNPQAQGSLLGLIQGATGVHAHPDVGDEKPQILNPHLVMNPQQAQSIANPSFLMHSLGYYQLEQHLFQPQAKRLNTGAVLDPNLVQLAKNPFADQGHELLLRKQHQQLGLQPLPLGLGPQLVPPQKPVMGSKQGNPQHYPLHVHQQLQLQEQAVKDQLFKAADLIQTGSFSLAQEILARLNHQLSLPAKPLIRAALYVKEALQMLLLMSNPVAAPPSKILTPYDVVHKMSAYKVFSEVCPITQFVNFTCTQAILEALDDSDAIHVVDFDIGCGAQWASLIQELPLRKRGAPSLKITAIAPMLTGSHFEISLVCENLVQFANDIGVACELQVVNFDLFDPSSPSMPNISTAEDESIAVSIPIWASSIRPSVLPSILRFIKQKSPKIVVSFDRGFDRFDVPFPQHLLHTLESCTNLLDSLDGLNVASDIVSKVEKFFVQPRIENAVLGRVHAPDKMPHWKNLFASAGFLPLQFSNFTETQADYVVKRTPTRGFHVEKRQASLILSWQRQELVAASAWKC